MICNCKLLYKMYIYMHTHSTWLWVHVSL